MANKQWAFQWNSSLLVSFCGQIRAMDQWPKGWGTSRYYRFRRKWPNNDRSNLESLNFSLSPIFQSFFHADGISSPSTIWALLVEWLPNLRLFHYVKNHRSWPNLMGFVSGFKKSFQSLPFATVFSGYRSLWGWSKV